MPCPRSAAHTGSILGEKSRPSAESSPAVPEATTTPDPLPVAESIARYELRFQSLFHTGRALAFPCDRLGEVQWDAMTAGARESFLRAQGGVGREWASPAVKLSDLH